MENQQENQLGYYATEEFKLKTASGLIKIHDSCDHLAWLSSDLTQIPNPDTPCTRCNFPWENWLCLYCKVVLCGRLINQHMLQHHQETKHCLTLGYSDLSVWCYSCNAYLNVRLIPQLQHVYENAYKLKYGPVDEQVGSEENQADGYAGGCATMGSNQKEGKRRRRRRRARNVSIEEPTKKVNETLEKMSNEGPEGLLEALSSSSASENNKNDLGFNNCKQCLCGQEAMVKISQSGKKKTKLHYTCKENKCDLFEPCIDNDAQVVDTILPQIQAALQNQIVDLVDVAELKAEVHSLTSKINMMESNHGLMKMMILTNLFFGVMLMVVVIAVLFKL